MTEGILSTARTPRRIQIQRIAGWRLPDGAVIVDRRSRYGNPFRVSNDCPQARAVEMFRDWISRPAQAHLVARARRELRGRDLACWCGLDEPCHADVWLEVANE